MTNLHNAGQAPERRRAISLFSFLKEMAELRASQIRDLEAYEDVLWLSSIPRSAGCRCIAWAWGRPIEEPDTWIEVQKPRLEEAPLPPSRLRPWMLDVEWRSSSTDPFPGLSESTPVPAADDTTGRRLSSEDPDLSPLWEQYIEKQWLPWRERDRPLQRVQELYTQLYSIMQRQQSLGEQFEVVLGLGLLSWRKPGGQAVRRHLIVARAGIEFDAQRGLITVGPSAEGARPQLEQDMLDTVEQPTAGAVAKVKELLRDAGDAIWNAELMGSVFRAWIHSASSAGDFEESLPQTVPLPAHPLVTLAPALILRRRSERTWVRAFGEVVECLQQGSAIPACLAHFVSDADSSAPSAPASAAHLQDGSGEIYFPLEANDDQRRILDRLARHRGVLVQGPPGTGKSHTIVNLLCHLLASGQRVLVTSHTARALRVLKRYIQRSAEEISPLAVLQLGEGADSFREMEASVQGITNQKNLWVPERKIRELTDLEGRLAAARMEEARLLAESRARRERETYRHDDFFGYQGTLAEIATLLNRARPALDWLPDSPQGAEPPLTDREYSELSALLVDGDLQVLDQQGWYIPTPSTLPSPSEVLAAAEHYRLAEAELPRHEVSLDHAAFGVVRAMPVDEQRSLLDRLRRLVGALEAILRFREPWLEVVIRDSLLGKQRRWTSLFETTRAALPELTEKAAWGDTNSLTWRTACDHLQARADAEDLLAHLKAGGKWALLGFISPLPVRRAAYLRDGVRLAGRSCWSETGLGDLIQRLHLEASLQALLEHWSFQTPPVTATFSGQVHELEDKVEALQKALSYAEQVHGVLGWTRSIPGFQEPDWLEAASMFDLMNCIEASLAHEDAARAQLTVENLRRHAKSAIQDASSAPPVAALLLALQRLDATGYHKAFLDLQAIHRSSEQIARRQSLLGRLRAASPRLGEALNSDPLRHGARAHPDGLSAAWNWARALTRVQHLADRNEDERSKINLEATRAAIRKTLSKLAATKAWFHCFERMSEHQREHLVAWSKAVRAVGKGTGKHAPLHREAARQHLNECRSAIPAWIMPLYRVAETVEPHPGIFDVAIIDEASQSGPEALLLTFLAKKLVVVGDDQQISPSHVGETREDVIRLRERHLGELPHAERYGLEDSFFDLAEIKFPGRIRLREHFRCMPEIIQFSNQLCYEREPLIPLRQYGAGRLVPVVSSHHVADGYITASSTRVVNLREADFIADWIAARIREPAYRKKTFGVISLQGDHQAREIERRLLAGVGPDELHARQLVCGDAYAFQGDERDVIVLSLVAAPTENRRIGVLTKAEDRRRFNVAASRARDQMLLVHTATSGDLSPNCLRFQLLQYCLNPTVATEHVGQIPLGEIQRTSARPDRSQLPLPSPFESWFEVDVFLRIVARGMRVIPQYAVAGYRIDLVVENFNDRLAVECDGDAWHGAEQYEDDMARQRVLERCGWTFYRIPESTFRLDPEAALEGLWDLLTKAASARSEGPAEWGETASSALAQPPASHSQPISSAASPSSAVSPTSAGPRAPSPSAVSLHLPQAPVVRLTPPAAIPAVATPPSGLPLAYATWQGGGLPDPVESQTDALIPGLLAIAGVEGPMLVRQLLQTYVKGAGGQRVGKQIREALLAAVQRALRRNQLTWRNEAGSTDPMDWVVREPGAPPQRIRPRGPREFSEIPESEIAAVLEGVRQRRPHAAKAEVHRLVLEHYDVRRLTTNIQNRLDWIEAHARRLLDETPDM